MIFYLGTHKPRWLWQLGVPLFVSARRLREVRRLPRARCRWALDSGGFSELTLFGRWRTSPRQYADEARGWQGRLGSLDFAAPQDWMCEPGMLARTHLSVREHQRRTTANYLDLCRLAPEVPWVPVLQGWEQDDYLRHAEDYAEAGVSLTAAPRVGLGSVCRRQDTGTAEGLVRELAAAGISLHAFGFKLGGLARCGRWLASSDSMAWSLDARRSQPLPGCRHKSCANCPLWALAWREKVLRTVAAAVAGPEQRVLW